MLQTITRLLPEKKLAGSYYEQHLPAFNPDSLWSGAYQASMNKFIEQHYGFRNFFTRLYNQIDYSLFRQPHANGVIIGKDGYLYEEWFISSYFGRNFTGDDHVNLSVRWLRQVRNYLKTDQKELLVMIAPGKTDIYPEYIPDRLRGPAGRTNYEAFTEAFRAAGIPCLDFNKRFKELKETSGCPLFSKTGTHWSHYGSSVATVAFADFLETSLNRSVTDFRMLNPTPVDSVAYPDNDLATLMNLFFPLRETSLCYPKLSNTPADPDSLPSGIIIGDSFFWEMYNLNLVGKLFRDLQFWYYNSSVYPESFTKPVYVKDLKFPDAYTHADVIVLMANPSNIQNLGWGFPERVFKEQLYPDWQKEYDKMVREYIQAIKNTPEWESQVVEKAIDAGVPKDTQMLREAKYMVDQYLLTQDIL